MKTLALVFFTISTLVFAAGFPALVAINMTGPGRVTNLDRAGVINEEILKKEFPALAQNTRYNVGYYITENHDTALRFFISFGFIVSLIGFIQAYKNKKTEPNQSLQPTTMLVTDAAAQPPRQARSRLI